MLRIIRNQYSIAYVVAAKSGVLHFIYTIKCTFSLATALFRTTVVTLSLRHHIEPPGGK